MNDKIEQLKTADWANIYKNLVAKTIGRMDKFSWRTNTYPKGHTPESIVQEAIEGVLNGTYGWDPNKGDLEMYLWWVIKGKLNRLFESKKHHPEDIREVSIDRPSEEEPRIDRLSLEAQSYFQPGSDYTNDPEDMLIQQENSDDVAELKIFALYESCNDRPELMELAEAIAEGPSEPKSAELAVLLDRPVEEIYQQLRALRRRAAKIKSEIERQADE